MKTTGRKKHAKRKEAVKTPVGRKLLAFFMTAVLAIGNLLTMVAPTAAYAYNPDASGVAAVSWEEARSGLRAKIGTPYSSMDCAQYVGWAMNNVYGRPDAPDYYTGNFKTWLAQNAQEVVNSQEIGFEYNDRFWAAVKPGDIILFGNGSFGSGPGVHIGILYSDTDQNEDKIIHSYNASVGYTVENGGHGDSWEGVKITTLTGTLKNVSSKAYTWFRVYRGLAQDGTMSIQKTSANVSLTEGNGAYSLEGAVYGIYSDAGCQAKVGSMTTDGTGKATSADLKPGTYYVKETKPSPGHGIDQNVYTVQVNPGQNTVVNGGTVAEPTLNDPAGLLVQKVDSETGEPVPIGGASLEGAEYTYYFFAGDYYTENEDGTVVAPSAPIDGEDNGVIMDADGNFVGDEPDRTWVVSTDSDGYAALDDAYLIDGKSDSLYYTEGGNPTLPIGTVVVRETSAPEGYLVSDNIFVMQVADGGGFVTVSGDLVMIDGNRYIGDGAGNQSDQVVRGDVELVKVDGLDGYRLAGIPFLVTSATTGEGHVIVTDANGEVSTSAEWNAHTSKTNANDEAVRNDADGGYIVDEDALDDTAGVWFSGMADGETEPDDGLGALPYDTYTFEELPVTANEGHDLVTFSIKVSRNGHTIDAGTVDDNYIGIGTKATGADGSKHVMVGETVTVNDAVSYEGLTPGKTYTLEGTLMDKATGEAVTGANGEAVTTSVKFIPVQISGSETVSFTFDTTSLAGHDVVVFERLLDASGKVIAAHEDIEDEGQTVEVATPGIGTTATSHDGGHAAMVGENVSINDSVSYSGLNPGETYTVEGTLMDKAKGEPLLNDDGDEIVSSAEFVPEKPDGTVDVSFTVDTTQLAGKELVVFEKVLSASGKVIATHEDIEDEGQTVEVAKPEVHTTASDGDGNQTIYLDHEVTVNDSVSYSGLNPGETYTVEGTLMDKATGEPLIVDVSDQGITATQYLFEGSWMTADDLDENGIAVIAAEDGTVRLSGTDSVSGEAWEIELAEDEIKEVDVTEAPATATVEFVPETPDGTVDVSFTVDTTQLAGKELVVFERLFSANGTLVGSHEDIEDEGQTVTVNKPEIGTELTDATDGDHEAMPSKETVLVDAVSYSGLTPGRSYVVKGVLMDQSTGEPVLVGDKEVTSEVTFVPNESSGSVELAFTFDSTMLAEGTNVVAFERLYYDGIEIAVHADLGDMAQTVELTETPDGTVFDKTGVDLMPVAGVVGAGLIAAAALGAYGVVQRRKSADASDADAADGDNKDADES